MGTSPLATQLRSLRAASGMTQEELAAKAGVSVATVVEIEAGRRRRLHAKTAWRLSEALNVDPAKLLEVAS